MASAPIAARISGVAPWILMFVGLVLLPFGSIVYWLGRQSVPNRRAVQAILAADIAGVVFSIALIVGGWVDFTTIGQWSVILVADMVALFAIGEWWGCGSWRVMPDFDVIVLSV